MKSTLSVPAILTILCLSSFSIRQPGNFFTIGNNRYSLSFLEIANESYNTTSKFEVDLMTEEELARSKTYIWFSLTGSNTRMLTNGLYEFSSASLSDRLPFRFNGAVTINDHMVKFTGGTISIETRGQEYDIQFILKLQNGNIAKGMYRGQARKVDRSHTYK